MLGIDREGWRFLIMIAAVGAVVFYAAQKGYEYLYRHISFDIHVEWK